MTMKGIINAQERLRCKGQGPCLRYKYMKRYVVKGRT